MKKFFYFLFISWYLLSWEFHIDSHNSLIEEDECQICCVFGSISNSFDKVDGYISFLELKGKILFYRCFYHLEDGKILKVSRSPPQ